MTTLKEMTEAAVVVAGIAILMALAVAWVFVLDHGRELLLVVTVLCVFAVVGCHLVAPPTPPPVDVTGTAEDCGPACDNLTRLGCPGHEGSPGMDGMYGTIDDVSCERACLDIVGADPVATLYQACVKVATSCAGADRCLAAGE